jgi:hypothetical protein
MLSLIQRPFFVFGLAPNVLGIQVRPRKVEEPDEAVLGSPLALTRITSMVKTKVRTHPFLTVVKGRISVL